MIVKVIPTLKPDSNRCCLYWLRPEKETREWAFEYGFTKRVNLSFKVHCSPAPIVAPNPVWLSMGMEELISLAKSNPPDKKR